MTSKVFTVSELTDAIKKELEPKFRGISVQGEISNFKQQASGHLYFSLKDAGSQVSAVLFRGSARNLPQMPKAGDHVIAKGEINIYPPRGNYQIIVRELQFLGIGELLLKLHELKEKLEKLGWFDPEHKKPLPKLPKKIGIVTSPTGAVIQDVLNVLTRRFSGFSLILNPVKVQGKGAAEEIAKAIEEMNQYSLADVLIVGRGGGSIEDLWAFNEEIVAKAIFNSKIPIISAVGHETDTSIADLVADTHAPTPSAAAEIVILEKEQLLAALDSSHKRIRHFLSYHLQTARHRLQDIVKQPVFSSAYPLFGRQMQELDDFQGSLQMSMRHHLAIKKELFNKENLQKQLLDITQKSVELKKERLQKLSSHLQSIDPKNLLKKGYSILFSEKDDSIILSAKQITKNQKLKALLNDGTLSATVNDVIYHGK